MELCLDNQLLLKIFHVLYPDGKSLLLSAGMLSGINTKLLILLSKNLENSHCFSRVMMGVSKKWKSSNSKAKEE